MLSGRVDNRTPYINNSKHDRSFRANSEEQVQCCKYVTERAKWHREEADATPQSLECFRKCSNCCKLVLVGRRRAGSSGEAEQGSQNPGENVKVYLLTQRTHSGDIIKGRI